MNSTERSALIGRGIANFLVGLLVLGLAYSWIDRTDAAVIVWLFYTKVQSTMFMLYDIRGEERYVS